MVKPDTIRKGSKVYFSDTRDNPVTVLDNVDGEISVQANKVIKTHADQLFPVPLTPEMIMRSGFLKVDEFVFEHPDEKIELDYDYQGVTHLHVRNTDTKLELRALHELQHAFWSLTNKDLHFS